MKKLFILFSFILCLFYANTVWALGGEIYEMPNTLDKSTYYGIQMDVDHHKVHEGESFYAYFSNATTNTGEMTCIAFNTPNTTSWTHMVWKAESNGAATLAVYENPSVDVDEGTAFTVINRNRNATDTSTLTSIETAPVANKVTTFNETQAAGANITTTTTIYSTSFGQTGNPLTVSGGGARGEVEYVLDQNQQYAICVVAGTDNDATTNLELNWYHHTDK